MRIAPINLCAIKSAQSFKGEEEKALTTKEEKPEIVIEKAIDRNTKALENLAEQILLNAYTIYAVEKSKSSTNGYHKDCYSNTNSPISFINYANKYWCKPGY